VRSLRPAATRLGVAGLAVVAVLLVLLPGPSVLPTDRAPQRTFAPAAPAPTILPSAPASGARVGSPGATAGPATAGREAPAPSAAPAPAAPAPAAPTPHWHSYDFFSDVAVSVTVPGVRPSPDTNFVPVPSVNEVPQYANGFWLNLSTDVPIAFANVTIWGNVWSPARSVPQVIPGYDPTNPRVVPMVVNPPFRTTASFYFNDYRSFWPGSNVSFNLTVVSFNATPSTIYSDHSRGLRETYASGAVDNATWLFQVQGPFRWSSFVDDVSVSTSPDVFPNLLNQTFAPNPNQTLQVTLSALNLSGGPTTPIPDALLYYTVVQAHNALGQPINAVSSSVEFGPINSTTMSLLAPIGPYPSASVSFNVTAWLPWEGGAIDRIYSPTYTFNWSPNGGWWDAGGGLTANVELNATPNLFALGSAMPSLPTDTPVRLTIHEPIENVTIQSAELDFTFHDQAGSASGVLPLSNLNANTSSVLLPGLPPGASVSFTLLAKDIYGTPISSGVLQYTESGAPAVPAPSGYGLFFFEVVDLTRGVLVPSVPFTVQNASWAESRSGSPLGFGAPIQEGASNFLWVAYGAYTVTVHAFGQTKTATFSVTNGVPSTVVFYVASGAVPAIGSTALSALAVGGVLGLVGATVAMFPLLAWFRERKKKQEAEQRRITL
jgi:hypothetical protein